MTKPSTRVRKEVWDAADEIYAIGFRNGQIEMKNKVLMKINRNWTLPVEPAMKILKMVNKIPLSKELTPLPSTGRRGKKNEK